MLGKGLQTAHRVYSFYSKVAASISADLNPAGVIQRTLFPTRHMTAFLFPYVANSRSQRSTPSNDDGFVTS